MTWIYQQPNWPDVTWSNDTLAHKLADLRHRQGRLLGRMATLGFELRQQASLTTITTDVIKSSAIEGEQLNPTEVRSSVAKRLGIDVGGSVAVSRDVDGVVEMMVDATHNYDQPLTQERLFAWHAALFPTGRSGMKKITVGHWRPESAGHMQVVSGALGQEIVHFQAPAALQLEQEMKQFLNWFKSDSNDDAVLKAGIAHLWFVTVHPFEDGNGRIARAIADMALARADATAQRFYSMSTQIEAERDAYYTALERQQRATTDITSWLDWFLSCLGRAIDAAESTLENVLYDADIWQSANRHPLNQRQRLMLKRMLDNFKGHMNTSKYAKMAKCSTDTALRDIRQLLEYGLLVQNLGGGRSTSYRLITAEELQTQKEQ